MSPIRFVVPAIVLILGLIACGSPSDNAVSGADTRCPVQPHRGACAVEGMACTYGQQRRLECRERLVCVDGSWQPQLSPSRCQGERNVGCPSQSHEPGDYCSTHALDTCDYDETTCMCLPPAGTAEPDAGTFWECYRVDGDDACPDKAPNLGSPCDLPPEAWCLYGFACRAEKLRCVDGGWISEGIQGC